ncbi:MAG: DUF2779 domain-containing protein [Deltaproteobacteria bacterium]
MATPPHLSKSRFVAGLQCHKQLWWRVNEPEAPELRPDAGLQAIFDRGNRVGEVARSHVPGGVLIDLPPWELLQRAEATRRALADGAKVVYEASFLTGQLYASVDILERRRGGFGLVEVKSTLDVKDAHLPDVGIQLAVVRSAGLTVKRAELMHLNRAARHPDLSNLFIREDVTAPATALASGYPREARAQLRMLAGPLPLVEPGAQCNAPYECPFLARCWPKLPEHHVSSLYRLPEAKARALTERGWTTLFDLPEEFEASGPASRQLQSVRAGELVVEPGLAAALRRLKGPIAFLDFETIAPAIPVWPGCSPYGAVPVQLSVHVQGPEGTGHHAWLAEGPGDPREAIAVALLDACRGAKTILAYNAPFERRCIESLAQATPRLGPKLLTLAARLVDLLPIVRDHVYHPAFGGSFSLKRVLPALVPALGYDDLEIQDGETAAATLEALLLDEAAFSAKERASLRKRLLAYCERDTLGMVRLHARLEALARERG